MENLDKNHPIRIAGEEYEKHLHEVLETLHAELIFGDPNFTIKGAIEVVAKKQVPLNADAKTYDPRGFEITIGSKRIPLDPEAKIEKPRILVVCDEPLSPQTREQIQKTIAKFEALQSDVRRLVTNIPARSFMKRRDWHGLTLLPFDDPEPIQHPHLLSYDLPKVHKVEATQRTKPSPGKNLGKKKWWEHR